MTKEQEIQQAKATALNSITKIYHPLYKGLSSNYWDDSYAEQRDDKVSDIVKNLQKELTRIKLKHK